MELRKYFCLLAALITAISSCNQPKEDKQCVFDCVELELMDFGIRSSCEHQLTFENKSPFMCEVKIWCDQNSAPTIEKYLNRDDIQSRYKELVNDSSAVLHPSDLTFAFNRYIIFDTPVLTALSNRDKGRNSIIETFTYEELLSFTQDEKYEYCDEVSFEDMKYLKNTCYGLLMYEVVAYYKNDGRISLKGDYEENIFFSSIISNQDYYYRIEDNSIITFTCYPF